MVIVPAVVTVAAGAFTWIIGLTLVKRIKFLSKYNLPAPVVGGLFIAILFSILHYKNITLPNFDTQLVTPLMIGFFTSLGFGASIKELRAGGRAVMVFLIACSILLIIQVILGAIVSSFLGKPPLFGVLTSAVSLVGGPGTALSFAPDFEKAGVSGAATAGLAAAMLGIVIGGLLGSPIATILINRNNLHANRDSDPSPIGNENFQSNIDVTRLAPDLLYHTAWILIIGSVGWYLSGFLSSAGIKLPFYIGSMIVASFVRNLDDYYGIFKLNNNWIDAIGGTCLTLFIAVSMMTLELWKIGDIAGPLLANLFIQTALVTTVAATIMFKVSGRDYDAAVISGGLVGFMMGTTANALATMNSITNKFGPAPRAFLVVPLVGACFIDFINAIVIAITLNLLS